MRISAWLFKKPGEVMVLEERDESPGPGEVIVETEACGVCHTDLGFFFEGVPTRHPLPIVLGHEVSGTVVEAGEGAEGWLGQSVIVPAVIPCEQCAACKSGRGSICPTQIFPGNDVHGGFASHLRVPARGLCPVPDLTRAENNPAGLELATLSVIADAVSTPFQAIKRSQLGENDLAIFVGTGGVGGFGVQIAAALGARVVAIDPSKERLELMSRHGASLCLNPLEMDNREIKHTLRGFAKEHGSQSWNRKIFETSGSSKGQETAFSLLTHGSYLSVVGYTAEKSSLRLANLMAFDATAQGNWGCLPQYYPAVRDLVLSGKVKMTDFVEYRPLSSINDVFLQLHQGRLSRRVVLKAKD